MKGMIMVGVLSFCVLWGNAQQILTLDECQDIAVENNKQGKLSDYSIQKAQLQVSNMNSNFLPKFSAVGGYLYANKDFGMELMPSLAAKLNLNNIYVGGVQLEQPLFLGGKLVAARKMAKMGLTIANLNKDKTDSDIRFEAEKAYWNVVKAKELLKVAEQYVETVDELYRTVENLYRTGMVSQNELLKVKVKVNETKLTRRRTENAVRLAKMSLCHQMGWPLDKEIDVANDLSDVSPSFDKIAYSLENRLEYKILSENINLKGQEVKAVRSEYLPRVGLVAGYNYMNGVKLNDNKLISDDLFAVMLSVKIPLFHWGEGARKIKSAKIERQIAEIQRDELAEKMELEISQAMNILDESELEVELTEFAFNEATESLRESKNSYETGMETLVNYMDAQSSWQKAWSEWITARIDYHIAKAGYLKATGQR